MKATGTLWLILFVSDTSKTKEDEPPFRSPPDSLEMLEMSAAALAGGPRPARGRPLLGRRCRAAFGPGAERLCAARFRSVWRVGRLSYVSSWVSCVLARSSRIVQEITRISPEFHKIHQNFTRCLPEFRQNIELEHLTKGDNHNSAFPQSGVRTRITGARPGSASPRLRPLRFTRGRASTEVRTFHISRRNPRYTEE